MVAASREPTGPPERARPETICHRTLTSDLAYCPQAQFHDRTIYFCTDACLEAFRRDPERFVAAHSRRRNE